MGSIRWRAPAAATLAAVLALVLTAPSPGTALRTLAGAGAGTPDPGAPAQALVALVALVAWALAGWSCAVVAVTAGGHLPGRAGRALAVVARRTVPPAVRHTVELTLGLTVAAGVLTPAASAATATAWPASTGTATAPAAGGALAATPPAPSFDWGARLPVGCPDVRSAAGLPSVPGAAPSVVVRPGDTLWDLAEQHLRAGARTEPTDAQVSASWPTWWAANREAIGDDPHLLLPGTVLQAPAGTTHPPAR